LIASSGYRTNGDWSFDEWFEVQEAKRNDQEFKKKYQHLRSR